MPPSSTRGHLVVVSNRLPVSVRMERGQAKLERAPGGLGSVGHGLFGNGGLRLVAGRTR